MRVVDSHTGGEPTRTIISGFPDLGPGPLSERAERMEREFMPWLRALTLEPRGSEVQVGAVLVPPHDPTCDAGVIFFNTVGALGMCGHGTIGVAETLRWLGRTKVGALRLDTPVGTVEAILDAERRVTVRNVRAYRLHADVEVEVPSLGLLRGDVAWGGNWFFLAKDVPIEVAPAHLDALMEASKQTMRRLAETGITGQDGAPIDHVEFFGPSPVADSRNFVLCPGGAYDRSPCGTGTSAKVACLAADGKLAPGQIWRQESVIGSVFEAWYEPDAEGVLPSIRGRAFVNADLQVVFDPEDPFAWGIG